MRVQFTADLWAYGEESGSWHFVTLPVDIADEVRDVAGPRRGFGSIRVSATVGDTTWQTSLFPDSQSASMVLPMKKAVRVAEGLEAGEPCDVVLEPLE